MGKNEEKKEEKKKQEEKQEEKETEEKEKKEKEEEEPGSAPSAPAVPMPCGSVKKLAEEETQKLKTVKKALKHKLDDEDSDCTRDAKKIAEHQAMAVARKMQHDAATRMFKPLMEEASRE